jgi:hypothetical protein
LVENNSEFSFRFKFKKFYFLKKQESLYPIIMDEKVKQRTNILLGHISPNLKKTSDFINHIRTTTKQNTEIVTKYKKTPDVLVQFSPIIKGKIKKSKVSYLSPTGPFTTETLQVIQIHFLTQRLEYF